MAEFEFYFRRYAPFARFGNIGIGNFEGDNRGPSTSVSATSRTWCRVTFNAAGFVSSAAGSSGTTLFPVIGGPRHGMATVTHKVTIRTVTAGVFEFDAECAGGNPLVPGAPDIDTYASVRVDWLPGHMRINGTLKGDNFPALECFLIGKPSGNSAMLFDGSTTGGANDGPATRLAGAHAGHRLGAFVGALALSASGDLATNYVVKAAVMPNY